jgi:probable phosphoglycerate mutase
MLRFVLIRPGATDYDLQGRIQGSLSLPLCDSGVHEVEQLIAVLRPLELDLIYSCEADPARQTATMLGDALDVKVKSIDELQNMNHGLWQGMLVDEVKRKLPKVYRQFSEQPECVCPPEGETIGEARERIQTVISKLLKKTKQGTIALVLPEPAASVARACLTAAPLGDLWEAIGEHGQWEMIEISAQPAAVSAANGARVQTST